MMQESKVTIGLIQMSCRGSKEENLAKAVKRIAEAKRMGAQMVALPELFTGQYFCQKKENPDAWKEAEALMGLTTQTLAETARKENVVLVGGSIFEKATDGNHYNTSVIFGPDGKIIGTYRKTHIPEDILYHEQHYFQKGNTGIDVFDTPWGKIAVLICYDQWFPEAARIATLRGADIIFYPTAIGVIDEEVEENITGDWQKMWTNAMVGHAACNNVYVCAINRTGKEGAIDFWGGSFVVDPAGAVQKIAGKDEEIVIATMERGKVKALQKAWRFLDCRRPDVYGQIAQV